MKIQQTTTAADSFHAHVGLSATQCNLIFSFIEGQGGSWSVGELAQALKLQKSTVSARVNELLAAKRLVAALKRKDRVSGILIRPVRIQPKQLQLFEQRQQ